MRIQRVSSKWAKTKVILQNSKLSAFIPETRKYKLEALIELLNIHGVVYIKPDRGTYGSGVMRAEQRTVHLSPSDQQPDNESSPDHLIDNRQTEQKVMYILRYAKDAEAFNTAKELHTAIMKRIKGRSYLIQKGIDLLCHQDLPFDLRVLTQKNLMGGWETTGMLGRVAAPQKVVTNYHNGGSIFTVHDLLKAHMDPAEMTAAIQQLKSLGVKIAAQLETAYPGLKEIGLDVALDPHHDMWLLEVNTLPAVMIFKTFPNKSIYRRIHRYAAAYGRFKRTKSASASRRKSISRLR
ncbi:YheC/YheD family protein [Paenibacillus sp. BAC0078]